MNKNYISVAMFLLLLVTSNISYSNDITAYQLPENLIGIDYKFEQGINPSVMDNQINLFNPRALNQSDLNAFDIKFKNLNENPSQDICKYCPYCTGCNGTKEELAPWSTTIAIDKQPEYFKSNLAGVLAPIEKETVSCTESCKVVVKCESIVPFNCTSEISCTTSCTSSSDNSIQSVRQILGPPTKLDTVPNELLPWEPSYNPSADLPKLKVDSENGSVTWN